MGFTSELRNDLSILWTASTNSLDTYKSLSYNIFKDITNTYNNDGIAVPVGTANSFKYFNVLYPVTNYLNSTLLIVETTEYINHRANSNQQETWRVAFEVTGYEHTNIDGTTSFVATQLKAYIGTKSSIYFDTTQNKWLYQTNTLQVILLEGGASSDTIRINETNLYSYSVVMAGDNNLNNKKRGLIIACWDTNKIETDMNYFSFLCVQRPVDSSGQPNDVGSCPVICVNNTKNDNGIFKISSNFYQSIIREKTVEITTLNTEMIKSSIYSFPNSWESPVMTDYDEYILEFPFSFCSNDIAFMEEMDMIAVSKGLTYETKQEVPIMVYGEQRVYTALAINKTESLNPIRLLILTGGGNTKPIY